MGCAGPDAGRLDCAFRRDSPERSWIYEHHPEWLVHNANGQPIHLGMVAEKKDQIYALDTTNPEAQAYLTRTYSISPGARVG